MAVALDKSRMLLHWVNSLPITSCLLVEELSDLRLGHELVDISRWVQLRRERVWRNTLPDGPLTDKQQVEERVRNVVHFAASECRSADGDAVFVVNQAQCATRVMEGDSEAIAAVLTVFRRLSQQQQTQQRLLAARSAADTVKLRALENALPDKRSAGGTDDQGSDFRPVSRNNKAIGDGPREPNYRNGAKKSKARPVVIRGTKNRKPIVITRRARAIEEVDMERPGIFRDVHGLHVFGMLDPLHQHRKSDKSQMKSATNAADPEMPRRVCRWIVETLGIDIPFAKSLLSPTNDVRRRTDESALDRKVYHYLQSGVLLCQIIKTAQTVSNRADLGIPAYPPNWSAKPQRRADSIRNIAIARVALKQFGLTDDELSVLDRLSAKRESAPSEAVGMIWKMLDTLREIFARQETEYVVSEIAAKTPEQETEANINPQSHQQVRDLSTAHPNGIPGATSTAAPLLMETITTSQTAEVNKWLHSLGFDIKKSPRGILHDTLRNGVILCSLRSRLLGHRVAVAPKPPRSHDEAREKITTALKDMSELIPASIKAYFMSSQAVEDILFGNCLSVYTLLWHVRRRWNYQTGGSNIPLKSRADASPLFLDIPAITLADIRSRQNQHHTDDVARGDDIVDKIEWESLSSDEGDLYPVKPSIQETWTDTSNGSGVQQVDTCSMVASRLDIRTDESADCSAVPESEPEADQAELMALQTLKKKLATKRAATSILSRQHPDLTVTAEQVDSILLWLKGINVYLENPEALQDPLATLAEFQSGVVLCRIVEKIEYMRGIAGVVLPKNGAISKASALHNIEKALSILQNKKTMPLHLHRYARGIYAGDHSIILWLLLQTRKAYMHRRPSAKSKTPANSATSF